MKAQIKPRINLDNRTKLQDVIPLDTPLILFVDPSSICNLKCKFCPTGHSELIKNTNRKQTIMKFDLYKKIIDSLHTFDKPLKVLRLYKEGEPLINKHLPEMIKLAKENNVAEYIDTTTNGSLLTPELSKSILNSGIDKINISVNGLSDEHYMKFTNTKIDFTEYKTNIISLYKLKEDINPDCEICIKIIGDFLTDNEKRLFFKLFGNCCDRIFIENMAPCWSQFNVKKHFNVSITKGIYNNELTNVDTCPYIFYSTTINSNGTVSLCFLDWSHDIIIGDVNTQSLHDIWNGDILLNYQIQNLSGKRKENSVCKNCGQLTHCLPDDIDPYRDTISKRIMDKRKIMK